VLLICVPERLDPVNAEEIELSSQSVTYLPAANDNHLLASDLPGEYQTATSLHLWELGLIGRHLGANEILGTEPSRLAAQAMTFHALS
jgi:hypothetical protein